MRTFVCARRPWSRKVRKAERRAVVAVDQHAVPASPQRIAIARRRLRLAPRHFPHVLRQREKDVCRVDLRPQTRRAVQQLNQAKCRTQVARVARAIWNAVSPTRK